MDYRELLIFIEDGYDMEDDEEGTLMTYVTEEKFDELIKKGNWDKIKNVFTLEHTNNSTTNSARTNRLKWYAND